MGSLGLLLLLLLLLLPQKIKNSREVCGNCAKNTGAVLQNTEGQCCL